MIVKPDEGLNQLAWIRTFFGNNAPSTVPGGMSKGPSSGTMLGALTATTQTLSGLANRAFNAISGIIKPSKPITTGTFTAPTTAPNPVTQTIQTLTTKASDFLKSIFKSGPIPATVKKGSQDKETVKYLQSKLNAVGASLVVDGIFGAKTEAAVIAFQRAKGLTADGIVGPKTWAALEGANVIEMPPISVTPSSKPTSSTLITSSGTTQAKPGDKGNFVKTIQLKLNQLGYAPLLVVDGDYGPKTTAAVKWFQKAKGLPQTGVVDSITNEQLLNSTAIVAADPSVPVKEPTIVQASEKASTTVKQGYDKSSLMTEIAATSRRSMRPETLTRQVNTYPSGAAFVEHVIEIIKNRGFRFSFFTALNPYLPEVIRTIAWHEGNPAFNNDSVGGAGEITTFQFMPATITSHQKAYKLSPLVKDDANSVASYLAAIMLDFDTNARNWVDMNQFGFITKAKSGNEFMNPVLAAASTTSPLANQLMVFFMFYNAGYSKATWQEEWRTREALARALSVATQLL